MADRRGTVAKLITMTEQFLLSIYFNNQCNIPDGSHTGDRGVSRLRNKMQTTHLSVIRPVCLTKNLIDVIELL